MNAIGSKLHRQIQWVDVTQAKAEEMLERGEITRDEYDRWRYRYPEFDTTRRHAKVISQGLSDFLTDALKDK